ncbi:Transcription factor IIIB subunit [Paragonimus heterotremus]|uniref:B-related factor 1 n=1 Tax=Paragonimus heterotremus TaxID=100268 RepID=A0A8J4T7D8_9TREM|nr:Transcription factor IIIB subunit [Paragonimus heterotremus]
MRCTHCGSTSFDEDRARADLVCLECGMVMSENVISSEVEFVETSAGVAAAVGRFVSDESQVVGRESRQVTENKARRRIDTICGHLRLGNDTAVSAFRYYQSALFRGLTRGRGALQVAAGCVYLAARQLRVNLMLLDLSDAVGINVYVLGHCYTDLKRRLNLAIPEMDPCLYIERFASQLEFGEKTSVVATTAMRLLQRMKKDWLTTGRRPSGLAAAALLVASRIHEFNRNEEDVARIDTLTDRKSRFYLELDEKDFARISAEITELERRIDCELQTLSEKRASRKFQGKLNQLDVGQSKGLQHLLDDHPFDDAIPKVPDTDSVDAAPSSGTEDTPSDISDVLKPSRNVLREVLDGLVDTELLDTCVEDLHILTRHSGAELCQKLSEVEEALNVADCLREGDASETKSGTSTVDTKPSEVKPTKLPLFISAVSASKLEFPGGDDGTLSLDGIDDDELDQEYLLHPREIIIKAAVWYKSNADYLQSARRKRLSRLRQMEEDAKNPPKKRTRRTAGPRPPRAVNRYYSRDKFEPVSEESEDKPLSKKINYEALDALVGCSKMQETGGSSTAVPGSSLGSADQSNLCKPGPLLASTLALDSSTSLMMGKKNHVQSVEVNPVGQILPSPSDLDKADAGSTLVNPCTTNGETTLVDGDEVELDIEGDAEEAEQGALEDYYEDEDDDELAWQQGAELW